MTTRITHTRVEANGIEFDVAVSGRQDAPAVLCLHGFPEGWMSWRPLMNRLGDLRLYAPDLRGYGASAHPRGGYDVVTLTDDVRALIEELGLERPLLVTHDWGGALGWIFAHRFSQLISKLVVVNCPHPKTLVRAVLQFEDFQTLRIPWVLPFQVPFVPELLLTTPLGRRALKLSFTIREGEEGTMDRMLVDALVSRFRAPGDLRGPIDYYREMIRTQLLPWRRSALDAIYENPITVPTTLVWGEKDGALSAKVALKSGRDAGCEVEWRILPGVGHFVSLEAPEKLAREIRRAAGVAPDARPRRRTRGLSDVPPMLS
jgi:pimeloyl-ACP methyl ester carboxylesterase